MGFLETHLAEPLAGGAERVCLGLIGYFGNALRRVITVSSLIPVPDSEYVPTEEGTAWSSGFTAHVLSKAMKAGTGVLMIHSHGMSSHPALSITDERSFSQALPRFRSLIPGKPHGSVVLGRDSSVGGRIAVPEGQKTSVANVERARWIEGSICLIPPPPTSTPARREAFDRQELVIGQRGQSLLNQATLGVVGLGGGGSHVVQQAAHAGFGKLALVDHDRVELSNMSRLVGASASDVGRFKADVLSAMVHRVRPEAGVSAVAERFPSDRGIAELQNADVIVSCLDSLTARVELQKFSWRYLIPLIDIGIGTRLTENEGPKRAAAVAGHVHVYLPGGPCMWCTGLLTEEKLEAESGGRGPEYVEGAANPAQVVSFNGVVASMAVTEAMQLVTGFVDRSSTEFFRTYDAVKGEMYSLRLGVDHRCMHSTRELGIGSPSGYQPSDHYLSQFARAKV